MPIKLLAPSGFASGSILCRRDIEFVLESAVRGFHVYRADYLRAVWMSFRTEAVRVAPQTVAEVTELVWQAVEQRTTRLTIKSFRSRPPAPQRRRRSRYKSRLQPSPVHLYTRVCVCVCVELCTRTCAHIYVRIRTCRIIRYPNNSRS